MSNVFSNIAGTIKSSLQLGKSGPSLRQGTVDPNVGNEAGESGDMYIQYGVTPKFFQKRGSIWVDVAGEGFKRTVVTSSSYTVLDTDHYIGVNHNGPVTINLPLGKTNKLFIIKDESGAADDTNYIQINPSSSETIDGNANITIRAGYTSISLVFGEQWLMI